MGGWRRAGGELYRGATLRLEVGLTRIECGAPRGWLECGTVGWRNCGTVGATKEEHGRGRAKVQTQSRIMVGGDVLAGVRNYPGLKAKVPTIYNECTCTKSHCSLKVFGMFG